jgi:hypothetical protein
MISFLSVIFSTPSSSCGGRKLRSDIIMATEAEVAHGLEIELEVFPGDRATWSSSERRKSSWWTRRERAGAGARCALAGVEAYARACRSMSAGRVLVGACRLDACRGFLLAYRNLGCLARH